MELSLSLATQIGALFIMIAVGYILIKKHLLKVEDAKIFSQVVLYICTPCAIINSFQIDLTPEKIQGFLLSLFAAVMINGGFIVLTQLFSKVFHFNNVEKASAIYSNCGNLIIPLVTIVMGAEMVFYNSGYMIVQTILLWTHCKTIISEDYDIDIKKIVFNINIIAIFIGLILFFTGIKVPTMIESAMTSMSSLMGPLSMFVVGMLLTEMDLKHVFTDKRAYIVTFLKLIVYPLIILLIFIMTNLVNIIPDAKQILMISLLAASGPAASTVTQFAQLYDNHPVDASVINALSVLCCIITMPLINMLYTMLCGM